MNIPDWIPFVPIYPNSQIPETKVSQRRVVEPSTRASVKMDPVENWQERVDKLREAHRNIAVTSYDQNGYREIPPIKSGQVFDFYS